MSVALSGVGAGASENFRATFPKSRFILITMRGHQGGLTRAMKSELTPQAMFHKRLAQYLDYMGAPTSSSDVLKFSFLSNGEDDELEEVVCLVQAENESEWSDPEGNQGR